MFAFGTGVADGLFMFAASSARARLDRNQTHAFDLEASVAAVAAAVVAAAAAACPSFPPFLDPSSSVAASVVAAEG